MYGYFCQKRIKTEFYLYQIMKILDTGCWYQILLILTGDSYGYLVYSPVSDVIFGKFLVRKIQKIKNRKTQKTGTLKFWHFLRLVQSQVKMSNLRKMRFNLLFVTLRHRCECSLLDILYFVGFITSWRVLQGESCVFPKSVTRPSSRHSHVVSVHRGKQKWVIRICM